MMICRAPFSIALHNQVAERVALTRAGRSDDHGILVVQGRVEQVYLHQIAEPVRQVLPYRVTSYRLPSSACSRRPGRTVLVSQRSGTW